MLTTIYYFLQVMLCSAVFMLYYILVLRNKKFHHYNRFYLLAAMLLSWVVPVLRIQFFPETQQPTQVLQLLNVVADNNTYLENITTAQNFSINWDAVGIAVYLIVCCCMLLGLMYALLKIYILIAKNPARYVKDIVIVFIKSKGAPFSFFKFIFWDKDVDLSNEQSKKMLKHELAHVREKHSIDNLLIQINLLAGWFNPIFWLIKKEVQIIHEFIADRKAVEDGSVSSLAAMLLAASYPQQYIALTNPFFFSPIKRRLQMLTNHKNPRLSYLRRIIVLPLLAMVVVLFAFRKKETTNADVVLDKKYTIVIDAGHGGTDKGALSYDGKTFEKDIALAFAKAIKEVNTNDNLEIILSRDEDILMKPTEKADFAKQKSADLFISLHANYQPKSDKASGNNLKSGIEIFIPKDENAPNYQQSLLLASAIHGKINKNLELNPISIKSRKTGIWVLQANPTMPSIIIETGYLTNPADMRLLNSVDYQKKFARKMLEGVAQYLSAKQKSEIPISDVVLCDDNAMTNNGAKKTATGQASNSVDALDNFKKTNASQYVNGFNGNSMNSPSPIQNSLVTGTNYQSRKVDTVPKSFNRFNKYHPSIKANTLYILNGEEINYETFLKIDENTIESISVLKDAKKHEKYVGIDKANVIEIVTKQKTRTVADNYDGDPSGIQAFYKRNPSVKTVYWNIMPLRMTVLYIDGTEETYNLENSSSKKRAEEKYGALPVPPPPPPPAKKGGGKNIFFTVATEPATFPGGNAAWQKYLQANLKKDIPVDNGAPPGKYSVMLSFVVLKDGQLKNIDVLNDPGYGTTEEALRVIKKGPKWKPAKQNGKLVDYQVKQTITLVVNEE